VGAVWGADTMSTSQKTNQTDPRTPVLIGCAQITDAHSAPSSARSPSAFVAQAAKAALEDAFTGSSATDPRARAHVLAARLDAIAVMQFFSESSPRFVQPFGRSNNPPASVAQRIGANAVREHVYTEVGGNMPQYLVNRYAQMIASGQIDSAMISGGELLRSTQIARKQQMPLDWHEEPGGEPTILGDPRLGWSPEEARHGLKAAIWFYPLIENAIRAGRGTSPDAHLASMARLFTRLAAVARDNPLATRREGYDAETLARIDASNRYIAYPYPRLMNANAMVDQSAAVVMTSTALADELGIAHEQRVYLHGCADAADTWVVSERAELDRSAAIRGCASIALDMAGIDVSQIDAFDLYSCFPSAVEVACRELGISQDDPRPLSVTGGLPYFGGPGNNYVTHSIAQMMNVVRARPGSRGMVTGNGSYLTKHSAGIYSTTPFQGSWQRPDCSRLQASIDASEKVRVCTNPTGQGQIETYTVAFDRDQPSGGIIFGRLPQGDRFVATVPKDPALLAQMVTTDQLGRCGTVHAEPGGNLFIPS
jgi:acetyl-CoA C-acetyltransferase